MITLFQKREEREFNSISQSEAWSSPPAFLQRNTVFSIDGIVLFLQARFLKNYNP